MDAQQYLWSQHRFAVGESVFVQGARTLGAFKIVSAYFLGTNLRLTLSRGTGNVIVSEDADGELPIMPANLINGEEIWHPKHGCGVVYAVSEDNKKLDMMLDSDNIVSIKMRKVRRIHLSPQPYATPYSTESQTPCQSSPTLSNLQQFKKSR
jgi:hypothetical protein